MKHKLKLKGKLQTYLQLLMLLGILLAVVDIWIYTLDIKAGVVLSGFVLFYLIMSLIMMNFNKSILMNELVSFATGRSRNGSCGILKFLPRFWMKTVR